MAMMRAVQVSRAKGAFELVERAIPEPGVADIRIKVEACGVCHSDMFVKEGLFPGISYPRIPGHEIIGTVDAVGSSVKTFQPRAAGGCGLAWGTLFCVRSVPTGRFYSLRQGKDCRHQL